MSARAILSLPATVTASSGVKGNRDGFESYTVSIPARLAQRLHLLPVPTQPGDHIRELIFLEDPWENTPGPNIRSAPSPIRLSTSRKLVLQLLAPGSQSPTLLALHLPWPSP